MKPYAIKIILQSPCGTFRKFFYRVDNKIEIYKTIRYQGNFYLDSYGLLDLEQGQDNYEWLIENSWERIYKCNKHPKDYPDYSSIQNIVDYT